MGNDPSIRIPLRIGLRVHRQELPKLPLLCRPRSLKFLAYKGLRWPGNASATIQVLVYQFEAAHDSQTA
jgi:hypothetical protein